MKKFDPKSYPPYITEVVTEQHNTATGLLNNNKQTRKHVKIEVKEVLISLVFQEEQILKKIMSNFICNIKN